MINTFTPMSVNIGNLIKEVVENKGLIKSDLATKMGLTNSALHKIFNKKDINTDRLLRFSEVIGYNFFADISSRIEDNPSISKGVLPKSLIDRDNENWKSKYYDVLEKYTKLLEDKKS